MEALKLHEEPKPLSKVRQELIVDFFDTYLESFGEKCTEPFLKCLGTLKKTFEMTDEETGEIYITYPDREEWKSELHKFFYKSKDNWYRMNNRCTFFTFVKNYGRYNHHLPPKQEIPLKTKPNVKQTRVLIYCTDCKKNHYSDTPCAT